MATMRFEEPDFTPMLCGVVQFHVQSIESDACEHCIWQKSCQAPFGKAAAH